MTFDIPETATTEEKLLEVTNVLEMLKSTVGGIMEEMEDDGRDSGSLQEAMEAMDDAIDAIGDAVDELEEEELELDEDFADQMEEEGNG